MNHYHLRKGHLCHPIVVGKKNCAAKRHNGCLRPRPRLANSRLRYSDWTGAAILLRTVACRSPSVATIMTLLTTAAMLTSARSWGCRHDGWWRWKLDYWPPQTVDALARDAGLTLHLHPWRLKTCTPCALAAVRKTTMLAWCQRPQCCDCTILLSLTFFSYFHEASNHHCVWLIMVPCKLVKVLCYCIVVWSL